MNQNQPNENLGFLQMYGAGFLLLFALCIFSFTKNEEDKKGTVRFSYDPAPTQHFVKAGSSSTNGILRMLPTKVYHVTVVPTVANGGSLDISGFGLTTVANVQVSAQRNTAAPNDVPTVALKSISTSSIVYNITQGNNAVVSIVGINVLSGTPNVFVSTPSDVTLRFLITGW